jgi:hypothetical protein
MPRIKDATSFVFVLSDSTRKLELAHSALAKSLYRRNFAATNGSTASHQFRATARVWSRYG